jgi:hypothetical protein
MRYRLLALDIDGTLLDPAGKLRPTVQRAVAAARARGLEVMVCTGRRFRTAHPIAQQLQLTMPLVVHNGVLVKAPGSGKTLRHCYLPDAIYQQGHNLLSQVSTPLVYIDALHDLIDIVTPSLEHAHPFQRDYVTANLAHCRILNAMGLSPLHSVVMMSIMADADSLSALRGQVEATLGQQARVQVLSNASYQGYILEILHPAASKWQALKAIAAQAGIAPADIIAIGDDWNDLEMIRHAGLGIAMGNALDAVKAAADYVTASNADDGLAQAIEDFVLRA